MTPTIGVLYSCDECGIRNAEVQVPSRDAEDVIQWMEKICIIALSRDHADRSPHCRPKVLTNIKIPMTGVDRVGGAPVQ